MSKKSNIVAWADLAAIPKHEGIGWNTRIFCTAQSCRHNGGDTKMCGAETIHLQSCSPDAANIFGCSEFEE